MVGFSVASRAAAGPAARVSGTAVVLAALLLAAVGCGGTADDGGGDDGESRPPLVLDGPVDQLALQQVCEDEARVTAAPAYSGPGPHPVAVVEPSWSNANSGSVPRLVAGPRDLQDALTAPTAASQLVGCVTRTSTTPTDVICTFDIGTDVPLVRATYSMAVREVRTGRVVTTTDLGVGRHGCPGSVRVGLDPEVYSVPSHAQYRSVLRPLLLWDGQGEPTQPPAPGATVERGQPVVVGPVTLVPPATLDATAAAVLADYHRYFVALATVFGNGGEDLRRDLDDLVSYERRVQVERQLGLDQVVRYDRRTTQGPISLAPVVRPARDAETTYGGVVVVEDCVDATGLVAYVDGRPNGDLGDRYPESTVFAFTNGRYVATGTTEPAYGAC